jgi:hypothetical protein
VEALATQQVTSIEAAISALGRDLRTLSLLGTEVRPMSIALLAPDAASIEATLATQGWQVRGMQAPGALIGALSAAVEADADPTVEIAPHFWRGMAPSLTLAAPSIPSVHARFWRTEFVTADGLRLFLCSVGSDATPEPGTPHPVQTPQAGLVQALDPNATTSAPITVGDVTLMPVTLVTR